MVENPGVVGKLAAAAIAIVSVGAVTTAPAHSSLAPASGTTGPNGVSACTPRPPHFRTRPDLKPVGFCVTKRATQATSHGLLLVTPRSNPAAGDPQFGIMIFDNKGRLRWYSRRPHVARDLKVVTYQGRRLLAFYQYWPSGTGPVGDNYYALYDNHYRLVKRITGGDGFRVNTHELQVTPEGTAYLASYPYVTDPTTGSKVRDYVIREVNIATGEVLFQWSALDHVPLSDSYAPQPNEGYWDYFHGNSIDVSALPTIVVSARNTSAVYGIDRQTGDLQWVLGGKSDQFGMVANHPDWQFCAQHDARRLPDGQLSIFDDGGTGIPGSTCPIHPSRTLIFDLDESTKTVDLARTLWSQQSSETGAAYQPWAMGSARRQPNGNMLMSWGTTGRYTEVGPDGVVNFGFRTQRYSYRAVRAPWVGVPLTRPAVLAESPRRGITDVWVSWNGSTRVQSWRVLAGPRPGALRPVGRRTGFAGFETHIRVKLGARYVVVRAYAADGSILNQSRPSRVKAG